MIIGEERPEKKMQQNKTSRDPSTLGGGARQKEGRQQVYRSDRFQRQSDRYDRFDRYEDRSDRCVQRIWEFLQKQDKAEF